MTRLSSWLGRAALLVAGLAALAALGGSLGVRWDPLGLQPRRLAAAQARAGRAEADARARTLERDGEREQRRRLDHHHQRQAAVELATAAAKTQAGQAHDAFEPLDPHRARRLGDHDRELCRLAPHLSGCPAAP